MAKLISGKVTSDKADKTIIITVTSRKTHPLYKKQYSVNTKYAAHDEKNEAKEGDKVVIRETRPLSARKRFILDKILERSGAVYLESDAEAGVELPEKDIKPAAAKVEQVEKTVEEVKEEVKEKAKPKTAKEKKA